METNTEATFKMINQDSMKLNQFDGTNFTRWKDKMMFLLTALKIAYILDPNLSDISVPTDADIDELNPTCDCHDHMIQVLELEAYSEVMALLRAIKLMYQ
uniref:Uncharacterized protein n=1 Tax=Ananas comosus var. bracteatus TaxID=296719 RepID=A0A6V7QJI9_ANACO|nr:unnamed protein product [Ananas comosus var. bracteatus]